MLFFAMIIVVTCQLTIVRVNGNLIRENRPLSSSSFDEIVIDGVFDVFLTSSSKTNPTSKVEIETTTDLQKHVIVEILDNHILSIRLVDVSRVEKHINVYITFPSSSLRRYTFQGTGNSVTDDNGISNEDNQVFAIDHRGVGDLTFRLNVYKLEFDLAGTGNSVFSGQVRQQARFNAQGTGDINALDLSTRTADVLVEGVSTVRVMATEDLQIEVTGISTVHYRLPKGKTPSKAVSTGLGKIVRLS